MASLTLWQLRPQSHHHNTWPVIDFISTCLGLWCAGFGYQGSSEVFYTQCQPYLEPNTGQKSETKQTIVELKLEGSCGQPHAPSHTYQIDPASKNKIWCIISTIGRQDKLW